MTDSTRIVTAALITLVTLTASHSQAEILTYQVGGVVIEVVDSAGEFPTVNLGDKFEGLFRFDTSTPGESDGDPSEVEYLHEPPFLGVSLTVEDVTFQTDPEGLHSVFVNDAPKGSEDDDEVGVAQEGDWLMLGVLFIGPDSTLSSAALPTSLQLGDWYDVMSFVWKDSFEMYGVIHTLTGPTSFVLGDVNCDDHVNGLDVDPFVDVLLNGTDDNATKLSADMNWDGEVNGLDVDPFVAAVVSGVHQIPEPSTLLLALVTLGVIGGWRKWKRLIRTATRPSEKSHVIKIRSYAMKPDTCSRPLLAVACFTLMVEQDSYQPLRRRSSALSERNYTMRRWILGLASFAAVFLPIHGKLASANLIFFVDNATISRANTDGTDVQTVVTSLLGNPSYIDLHVATGMMYWTNGGRLQRSNLDGSGLEDIVTASLSSGIALDRTAGKVYWTNLVGDNTIQRANLDGTSVENLVTRSGSQNFRDIALDLANGHMYWCDDNGATAAIRRADLDGGNAITVYSVGLDPQGIHPQGIDLDLTNNKIYWTDRHLDSIVRSNLDGSNVETLITGLGSPESIKLDVANSMMYWSDTERGTIQRADLDGSRVETLVTGLSGPRGIAIMSVLLGDVNLDGKVNGLDVDPFVDVLLNGSDDNATRVIADMNSDGEVNGLDVDPFVAAVVGGVQNVPEPTTLLLCIIALGVVGALRKWGE